MMKSLATVATLALVAFATQPALAQDKQKSGGDGEITVAGRPALPTDLDALFKMRESWGEKPSVTSEQADLSEGSDKKK